MQKIKTRANILIGVFSIAILVVALYIYGGRKSIQRVDIQNFPVQFAGWSGQDIPVNERTYQLLQVDEESMLFRHYRYRDREDKLVELCIVAGMNNRESFHPPEVCYSGKGTDFIDGGLETVEISDGSTIEANRLVMDIRGQKQVVLYWYTAGKRSTPNYYRQQLYIVFDELRYRQSKGALVRISALVDGDNIGETLDTLKQFIGTAEPLILEIVS